MKMALLLSGGLRGFGHAFTSWDWMMEQVTDTYFWCLPPGRDETPIEKLIPQARGRYVEDDPRLNTYTHSGGIGLDPPATAFPLSVSGHVTSPVQFCAIENCFAQLDGYYDVVIRCRPDNLFQSRVDFGKSVGADDAIWIPDRFSWGGYCDRFAFGRLPNMANYAQFYRHLNDWTGKGSPPWHGNSETRLLHYLTRIGARVHTFDLAFHQVDDRGNYRNDSPQDYGLFRMKPEPAESPLNFTRFIMDGRPGFFEKELACR